MARHHEVQKINAYVNSRHPRPAHSLVSTEEEGNPDNPLIHPEWKALLDQYHRELDSLREDWALEVLGRYAHIRTYFRHRERLGSARERAQTLPWYMPTFLYLLMARMRDELSWDWEFRVKERILPLWWGPLKWDYNIRKIRIDNKYDKLLGVAWTGIGINEKEPE